MPRTVVFEGVKHTFPDDATDAEIAAALDTAAPAEAAPTENPSGYHHPLARFGSGALSGLGNALKSVVDPNTYIDTAKLAYKLAKPPMPGLPYEGADAAEGIVKGVVQLATSAVGLNGPEAMGEAVGGMLPGAIPVGEIGGMLGNWMKTSRVKNVLKATGAVMNSDKARLEKMVQEGRISLPVSATRGSLAKKLESEIKNVAGPELETAKAGLQGLPDVSVQDAVDTLKAERPAVTTRKETTTVQPRTPAGFTSEKPAPITTTATVEASLNRPLLNAIDSQIDEIVRAAGPGLKIKPEHIQKLKEQAQAAAAAAYDVARGTGQEAGAGAQASEHAAKALRDTLENSPDIPADVRKALTEANDKMSALMATKEPTEAARLTSAGKAFSRSLEALAGRATLPSIIGGFSVAGPVGAAAGVGAGMFAQSALFNTLSAAGKAKVGPILQSEGVQAAVQAAFAEHIAENAARRQREQ